MSTVIPGGGGPASVVLLVVLIVGLLVGRSKRRWFLLLAGIAAVAVVGYVVTTRTTGAVGARPEDISRLYTVALPPLVAFVAGWLCARGSWFGRIIVIAAAVFVLAAFPYPAAGRATVQLLPPAGSAVG